MKRLLVFILNPFLLAFWSTIIVLIIFPIRFPKYLGSKIESEKVINDVVYRYDDLDGDGESEQIFTFHNSIGKAGISVNKNGGAIEQWNLYGTFNFIQRNGTIITGDRDANGFKEIYIFTISQDSIYLSCIEDIYKSKPTIENRFIARCGKSKNKVDAYIISAEMDDLDGDGLKELIFGITTGFSIYPRQVFAYDFKNNNLLSSPQNGYFIMGINQKDVTGDGKREIIPWGYAASNIQDSTAKYHDRSSWLMVLDRRLNFLFEPVEFKGQYSTVKPMVVENAEIPLLMALICPPQNKGDSTQLLTFTINGKISNKRMLSRSASEAITVKSKNGNEVILIGKYKDALELYDSSLTLIRSVKIECYNYPFTMDVDLDGNDEILVPQMTKRKLLIYRYDLSYPVELDFDGNGEQDIVYSIRKQKNKPTQLALQYGSNFYLYQYGINPKYNLRFVVYASIYICVLLFTQLVRKIQRVQIQRKLEIERKITELQLQIVRNQLDPHFTMNAINSIIASIQTEEKEEARQHLLCFSKLHRTLLLSSDQIGRTLREEIDFTNNYLALEKFRFKEKFNYAIDIGKDVNLEVQIPKMILQIHVENAVKHGICSKEDGGVVTIRCLNEQNKLIVEVEDNGIGRKQSSLNGQKSTGKGQIVMDQLIKLYNKHSNSKISSNIFDLFDAEQKPVGTKVKIFITNGN